MIHWPDYEVSSDAVPALRMLKEKGLKAGLITNSPAWIRGALEASELYGYLDDAVISCEVGLMKPEKEIFELALKRMNCEPADAIMVGDEFKADVLGAENAGMTGILLDRSGSSSHPEKIRKIQDLTELKIFLD
jgi:putative hydrolase of the HAD superfamily